MYLNLNAIVSWFSDAAVDSACIYPSDRFSRFRISNKNEIFQKNESLPENDFCCLIYETDDRIECRCGTSSIVFSDMTLEMVINGFLALCETYHSWESKLSEAIRRDCSIQELFDISQDIFQRPMVVQNESFHILAISNGYFGKINDDWDYNATFREFITNSMLKVKSDQALTRILSEADHPIMYDHPLFHMKCISAPILRSNTRIGLITILAYNRPFTDWDLDLVEQFTDMIRADINEDESSSEFYPANHAFFKLLTGNPDTEKYVNLLQKTIHFQEKDSLILLRFEETMDFSFVKNYLLPLLQHMSGECAAAVVDKIPYLLLKESCFSETYRSGLQKIAADGSFRCCISLPFRSLVNLPRVRLQTELPLRSETRSDCRLLYCKDYIWNHLEKTSVVELLNLHALHPGALQLRDYDSSNNTELAMTVCAFLRNERNLVKTSSELHIHRNTLVYRIKKAEDLIHCDWNLPSERFYLLFSLRALDFEITAPFPTA